LRFSFECFFGAGAQNLVGDFGDGAHFADFMDTYDVGAAENRDSDGRGSGEPILLGVGVGEETLARGAGHDGEIQLPEVAEPGKEGRVLFLTLAEAEAGVDNDARLVDADVTGAGYGGIEIAAHGGDGVGHRAEFGPGLGPAAHVIDDESGVVVGNGARELGFESEAAGIVNDSGAEFERALGDFGFVGVDGDGDADGVLDALEDGDEALEFDCGGDAVGPRLGGFGADVDDVGALLLEFDGSRERAVGVGVFTAVGERVGGDVENAHQQGSVTETEFGTGEFPDEVLAH